MDEVIKDLFELAIWANLDKETNHELILLKGHLYVEKAIESSIQTRLEKDLIKFSFYKKLRILELELSQSEDHSKLIECLYKLNNMRNQLAHEYNFDVYDGRLSSWAQEVLSNFQGEKFSRYTYRTKIIHAFSTLSINLLGKKD